MRVGFVGLGAIGRPMAARLARAHDLTVWNRTRAVAEAFAAEHGAACAETPRQVAEASEVVLTCLPNSSQVLDVLEGPTGLAAGLAPGTLLVDSTSGEPAASREIARRLADQGVGFADAPVSGGTNGAEAGTLTVMVGAEPEVFARAEPVLRAFGSEVVHLGPVGAGHAMKAVNNALLALNILAFAEGATALVRAGVSAGRAVEVLNASSGRSFVSEHLVPARVLTGAYPNTFRLALLAKDAGIAVDLLESLGLPGPLFRIAAEECRRIQALVGDEADYMEPIRVAEQAAEVEIRG